MTKRISTIAVALATATILLSLPASASVAAPHPQHNGGPRHHVEYAHRKPVNYTWDLFKATNASRRRYGIAPLKQDRELASIVRAHSAAMARSHALFHTADVHKYLRHVSHWHCWGENIGWTSGSLAGIERAFMNSTSHRANILSRSFHHVALGVVKVGQKFWVTVFFYG